MKPFSTFQAWSTPHRPLLLVRSEIYLSYSFIWIFNSPCKTLLTKTLLRRKVWWRILQIYNRFQMIRKKKWINLQRCVTKVRESECTPQQFKSFGIQTELKHGCCCCCPFNRNFNFARFGCFSRKRSPQNIRFSLRLNARYFVIAR